MDKPAPLILVAEDERDIRELIVFTLEIADFRVVAVPNGQEAVKKAVEISPDLILMDVRMPKMNGFEACKALKQQEKTKDIPVLITSGKQSRNLRWQVVRLHNILGLTQPSGLGVLWV